MEKEFDAVKEMRAIREKLHKEFENNPALRRERLKAIHRKYKIKVVQKTQAENGA